MLAGQGARGLTHRAVDQAAGLPSGTTSNYARTRAALLTLALARIAELDAAEGAGGASELSGSGYYGSGYPVPGYLVLGCPVLGYLVLDCPVLGYLVLGCPVLSWPRGWR